MDEKVKELHRIFMEANNFLGELKFYSAQNPNNKSLELAEDSLKFFLKWCSTFILEHDK